MKYLKKFKTKADAVGQTIAIPSVLSIKETPDSVGYLNTDIGIKETEIVDTEDKSFVEGEYMQYITITYNVSSTTSTTKILYTVIIKTITIAIANHHMQLTIPCANI